MSNPDNLFPPPPDFTSTPEGALSAGDRNILRELYSKAVELPLIIRKCILEECSWSMPTFYRKMHGNNRSVAGKVQRIISNAEKEKIIFIFEQILLRELDRLQKYKL